MICREFISTGLALMAAFVYQANIPYLQAVENKIKVVHGYNYELPKLKKGARLLFQGDSITDMKWGRNQKDRNHYLGHSYVFLL
ncbi:MAG: hypothetical protein CMI23_02605, partial [Opitutae bacterium]|nr:hypothetical protein [Opitutae bacterium]